MRKIILHFAVTLDGIVPNVEQRVALNDEVINDTGAYQDSLDEVYLETGHCLSPREPLWNAITNFWRSLCEDYFHPNDALLDWLSFRL